MSESLKSNNRQENKLLTLSWLPWILILFEMFYMASPFAIFFYSAYRMPLKILNSSKMGSWFVQTILPHFVETKITALHVAMELSWIIMGVALLIFFAAFFQIYYSKFKKRGAVTGGIYKFIRHPQYTAWTVFGFAMCVVWSRLIVWVMFLTMTMIYYFLARLEEKECLIKFPSYRDYFCSTGMFFPKLIKTEKSKGLLPEKGIKRILAVTLLYFTLVTLTIITSRHIRSWTISQIATSSGYGYMALSLNYIDESIVQQTAADVMNNNHIKKMILDETQNNSKLLLYIMPVNWTISELGMTAEHIDNAASNDPQNNPMTHGNPEDTTPHLKKILISEAVLNTKNTRDSKILHNTKNQNALLIVHYNLSTREITSIQKAPFQSQYKDIPVPVF